MNERATQLIASLGLIRHPEGGNFQEIFRSGALVQPGDDRPARAAATVIYFLLLEGQFSRWHRVRSDEVWQFCEGDPLELLVADAGVRSMERIRLGTAGEGQRPVHVVPANCWQAARPLGGYALTTCVVAPGFDYADFSFIRDHPEDLARIGGLSPDLALLI